MIRALAMVAVAGFVLAIAALSGAFTLGGPDAIARGSWAIVSDNDWDGWGDRHHSPRLGAETTRTLTWTGGDTLKVSVPADVEYIQADGAPSITVSGPQRLVDRVVVEDGRIIDKGGDFGWSHRHVKIRMTAPNINRFALSGSSELAIRNYKQDRLSLDLSGSSEVEATGDVRLLEVEISGSGEVELAGLTTKEAEVDISGSGEATIAPTERANIEISGSGDVTLTTNPKQITSDISGSGDINRRGGGEVGPTPPTPPTPPAPGKKT